MIKIPVAANTGNASGVSTFYVKLGDTNFPLFSMDVNSYLCSYINTSIEQDKIANRPFVHNIHIGKYCSIALDVDFCVGSNHNYRSLSTSGTPNDDFNFPNKGQILVQNDVWIGHGAPTWQAIMASAFCRRWILADSDTPASFASTLRPAKSPHVFGMWGLLAHSQSRGDDHAIFRRNVKHIERSICAPSHLGN